MGSSGFCVANLANAISVQGLGDCTAEARPSTGSGRGEPVEPRRTPSKELLIKKFSDLCELCASAVNISSQETRNNRYFKRDLSTFSFRIKKLEERMKEESGLTQQINQLCETLRKDRKGNYQITKDTAAFKGLKPIGEHFPPQSCERVALFRRD